MKLVNIKRLAHLLILLFAFVLLSGWQNLQGADVRVTSNPSGASVVISGDISVTGVTPATFKQNLQGFYQITAFRPGYEIFRSSIVLSGSQASEVEIQLVPKTKFKAGIRSLFVPGWGQRYYGSKGKGTLLTIGTLAAGVVTGLIHLDYDNKRDDYEVIKRKFDQTRKVTEKEAMLDQLYSALADVADAEDSRNVAIGVTLGIWAYSVLDAIIFFPDFGINISGAELGFEPQATPDKIGFYATLKF